MSEELIMKDARPWTLSSREYSTTYQTLISQCPPHLCQNAEFLDDHPLERSKTFDNYYGKSIAAAFPNPPDRSYALRRAHNRSTPNLTSDKHRFDLQLPSFEALGISTTTRKPKKTQIETKMPEIPESAMMDLHSTAPAELSTTTCGVLPPLTPPPEDMANAKLDVLRCTLRSNSNVHASLQSENVRHEPSIPEESVGSGMQDIILPERSDLPSASGFRRSPWIMKASHKLVSILDSSSSRDFIQVVSQTLPSQAKDGRSQPTFEELLDMLQTDLQTTPYITITHAVPQARAMDDLPKTPPSTPNSRHETNDYFGNDQTIFTHAAVVPIYHTHDRIDTNAAGRLAHHIAAPCSINVSILERYIPPTMPQEVDDFFSLSSRSYLVDRLSELSASSGTLLLIFPTRKGGETFARNYIGPVIDPYLRRFVMLNGLTSQAAALMGRMTAVSHMIEFETMQERISSLCQSLSMRPSTRGHRSLFEISHAEISNVKLDRSTWINWYVEQEQSRLRQNLVDYHQSGGRMPEAQGNREITVGMLVRDFIDGLQQSTESAGDMDIEVGVFLITRSVMR